MFIVFQRITIGTAQTEREIFDEFSKELINVSEVKYKKL